MNRAAQRGFSLLELIMVMLVVAVASVPILGQFEQVAETVVSVEEIRTATQLARSRSEEILALRRRSGYAAVAAGVTVDVPGAPRTPFVRSVEIADPGASGGCPAGGACKRVRVSVDRGSRTLVDLTFVLMDY